MSSAIEPTSETNSQPRPDWSSEYSPQTVSPENSSLLLHHYEQGDCRDALHCARYPNPPISLSRVAWLILDCARRTSTFLSCAFREQEDDQAALPILPRPRAARARSPSCTPLES